MIWEVLLALFATAAAVLLGDLADAALGYGTPVWSIVLGALALAAGLALAVGV